jgi:hypothetical protein
MAPKFDGKNREVGLRASETAAKKSSAVIASGLLGILQILWILAGSPQFVFITYSH